VTDELVDELIRATTTIGEHYYASAAGQQLGVQEARLLYILSTEPSNMLGLASTLNLPKSTITGIMARMEAAGLVVRERGSQDRRNLVATPTAKGRTAAAAFAKDLARRVEGVMDDAGLDDTSQTELASILSMMLANVESGER
jgi:DNA-binding MarR family transcriptional regulator